MDLNNVQMIVDSWIRKPGHSVHYFPPFEILSQLQEELGEVCREVSHLHGHKKKKEGEVTDGLSTEIGDLLFALVCLANSEGVNLNKAFMDTMDKKSSRDEKRFMEK